MKRILKQHKNVFQELEHYDKTRELSRDRLRIDVTLDRRVVKRLRRIRERTGKPVSRIIEEALQAL